MGRGGARIDGWKAIASYLGRDRSTAIRWANERGMPVHSLPGGKARTVYALPEELDAWRSGRPLPDEPPPPLAPATTSDPRSPDPDTSAEAVASTPSARRPRIALALAAVAAVLCLAGVVAAHHLVSARPQGAALGGAQMARFLQARDDIAARSTGRLRIALAQLEAIAAERPAHLGTHEALAEGYLLAREFGSISDVLAFTRAREQAEAARRLDPDSATADRVDGLVTYWADRDPQRAGRLFRRAIEHAPQDALAHLWYANILADNGEDAAAAREFTAARLLAPAASYLLADLAWGTWSAGRSEEGERMLEELAAAHPELASVHDCLSVIAFARGDLAGYAAHLRHRAEARNEPELTAYSASLERALASGSDAAAYAVIASRANAYAESAARSDHSWPAFVVSVAGDEEQLRLVLRHARERGERWGSAGFVRRIAARWHADAEVTELLQALRQPRIE